MISILIPIYNGIEFISESVPSILQQTYGEWELLIGINGHPPNSEIYKIAKLYESLDKRIKVLDFYNIRGKSNTLNELIKYCKYNYIALLDVDDIWHPQKLQIQSQLLNKFDVIGSACVWIGDRPGFVPQIPTDDITNFDFSIVNPIINSSVLIKKEYCFWNGDWDGVEDYDLWLRLRKLNKKMFNFKEILVFHRIHQQSAFNSGGKNNNKVDQLLSSHVFSTRKENNNDQSKIKLPRINRINMIIG
jgi:glycosyltransferase involved in cell wall biosynthesis